MAFFKVKLLTEDAKVPTRATSGSAGYDLYASEDTIIDSGERGLIGTGISMEIPSTCYGRIASRSGLAVNKGIDVGAGTIDSDFLGQIRVLLFNHGDKSFIVTKGDRIAQIIIHNIITPDISVVTDLTESERGQSGFGSTGMK